jgi:hypothetical protein
MQNYSTPQLNNSRTLLIIHPAPGQNFEVPEVLVKIEPNMQINMSDVPSHFIGQEKLSGTTT